MHLILKNVYAQLHGREFTVKFQILEILLVRLAIQIVVIMDIAIFLLVTADVRQVIMGNFVRLLRMLAKLVPQAYVKIMEYALSLIKDAFVNLVGLEICVKLGNQTIELGDVKVLIAIVIIMAIAIMLLVIAYALLEIFHIVPK